MRYIPLTAHERGYVGSKWNAKFLRAVQRMLVPTQGKGVCNRNFFEADLGKSSAEFVRYLCMPEKLLASRGIISTTSRGKSKETDAEYRIRKAGWERDQLKIKEWNRLYSQLGDEWCDFVNLIGDNEYLPEKVLGIASTTQKQLYLLYLTIPRLISLLGLIDSDSPTADFVRKYITDTCPCLYSDILDLVSSSESQQQYIFKNFIDFFGKKGVTDLLTSLETNDFSLDKVLSKWNIICKKQGIGYVDFELIRVYRRFVELNVLSNDDHNKAKMAILNMDVTALAAILYSNLSEFTKNLSKVLDDEKGQKILKNVVESISNNIQLKLDSFLEDL